MQKIVPCLWFNFNAEKAVKFYASVFKNVKIKSMARYPKGVGPAGKVMTIFFTLNGQEFMALNGGPNFKFTEAISLMVNCKTQKEIDYYWKKLTSGGGKEIECSWLKDKFGLFWQIVPADLGKLLSDKDVNKTSRVMGEVMKMKKLDIKRLRQAYKGK